MKSFRKFLLAAAFALVPFAAQAANQYTQTVSVTSTATAVTFPGLNAAAPTYQVFVLNDGPSAIYVSTSTTAVSTDNTSLAINSCEGRVWTYSSALPTFSIVTASGQTATARAQAFASSVTLPTATGSAFGAVAQLFNQCYAPTPNQPLLGATSVPASAAAPALTLWDGQPTTVGTSNVAGGSVQFGPGIGTGNGAGSAFTILRNLMGASGTAAQAAQAPAYVACESKTMSNTSATLTTMAQIASVSNSGGSGTIFYGTVASDGTNFDSDAASMNFSWVNKAGTVTTAVGTLSAIAQASNSGTVASTASAPAVGANINLSLSPTYVTIVPTSVTSYMTIVLHTPSGVTVTCQ